MSTTLFENGGQIRYVALAHRNFSADSTVGGVGIPSLTSPERIRRVIFRNLGAPVDVSFTGGDPTAGFRLLADEITVHDGDPTKLLFNSTTGTPVEVRAVLMGT